MPPQFGTHFLRIDMHAWVITSTVATSPRTRMIIPTWLVYSRHELMMVELLGSLTSFLTSLLVVIRGSSTLVPLGLSWFFLDMTGLFFCWSCIFSCSQRSKDRSLALLVKHRTRGIDFDLAVDTQFCTHNLTLEDDQNNHSKYPKIIIVFHALNHSSHIIKMILKF